jgi:hypothetical protein
MSGTSEDDARRIAQGGKTFDQQDQIAQGSADAYQSKVDSLNRQESVGRTMGLGGRAMWRGIAAIPDIVATPLAAGVNWLGDKPDTTAGKDSRYFPKQANFTQSADFLMDQMGAPRPETAAERIGSEATSAITGGALPVGLGNTLATSGSRLLSGIGQTMKSSPLLQLLGAGSSGVSGQTAQEMGASPFVQMMAGLGGGLTPAAFATGGSATLRALMRGQSGDTVQRNIDAFRGVGTTPSAGQAAGNKRIQGFENLLAGGPTSTGAMGDFAERQAQQIGEGLQAKADSFYPKASGERAGRAIERGANDFATATKAKRSELYDNADKLIPGAKRIPMDNTRRALDELTAVPSGAPLTGAAMINPEIKTLAKNVLADLEASKSSGAFGALVDGPAGIDYQSVRNIRTRIGEELDNFTLVTDRPTAQYKHLYEALSKDLEAAARAEGPAATRAMERANTYYRASQERLEQIQRVVDKNGGSEKVYQAAMAGTKDGGTTLRAVMQSLPPEGQRAVTAAVIKRMGLARAGQQGAEGDTFSAQTFLTNWNSLSIEARKAMFDRHGPQFAKDMDQIAQVAENIRNGSRVFQNPSGTANKGAAYGYWLSMLGALGLGNFKTAGGLAAGGAGAWGAAKAFTNPNFVHWLAQSTKAPVQALPGQLTTLQRVLEGQGDEETAQLVADLRDRVNGDLYGNTNDQGGLEVDVVGGHRGAAPTAEEMRQLRAGLVR